MLILNSHDVQENHVRPNVALARSSYHSAGMVSTFVGTAMLIDFVSSFAKLLVRHLKGTETSLFWAEALF